MKEIVRHIKELIEASEPGMTVAACCSNKPPTCLIGERLWQEYRRRNPDGLKIPPHDLSGYLEMELLPYVTHVENCADCYKV